MAKFYDGKKWVAVRINYNTNQAIISANNGVMIATVDDDGYIVIGRFRARLYNLEYQEEK